MWKNGIFSCTLAAILLVLAATPAGAVVIFLKGSDQPVVGFIVREDAVSVRIEQVMPDGSRRLRELVRSQIDDILVTVSRERLEKLTPEHPEAYRDYAEELAPKQRDPEARETAIRLYLIAAHLAPQRLGRSAMLGLIQLAGSERQQRAFRAMAYLLDPEHDARVLRQPVAVKVEPQKMDAAARERLAAAVQLVWQDRKYTARKIAEEPAVAALLEQLSDVMSPEEFKQACEDRQLTGELLSKLVKLRLILLPEAGDSAAPSAPAGNASWLIAVRRNGLEPVPPLTLETLTPIDPRQCVFRDGKWVEPD